MKAIWFLHEKSIYRISLISHTFLHENSHVKNGVRLIVEMRHTFEIFVELTVRHAYAYTVFTQSHMPVSLHLVKGNIRNKMMTIRTGGRGATYNRDRVNTVFMPRRLSPFH